jgi:hypothetical protein
MLPFMMSRLKLLNTISAIGLYASQLIESDLTRYHYVTAKGHPLADKQGHLPAHRLLLYEAIGPGTHPCHWCNSPVTWMNGPYTKKGCLVVDHIDNDGRNNTLSNLVASCQGCNTKRHKANLVSDQETFMLRKSIPGRHRAVQRSCELCGSSLLVSSSETRSSRGRFCSMSCARRAPRRGRP